MITLTPYLNFNGDCGAAFRFYQQTLGGELQVQTHGESPMEGVPEEWRDRVIHARLVVGDAVLMGSDTPAEHHVAPAGTYVALGIDEPAEADRIFHALAEGGSVQMPIQQTFWARRFGMLADRFGTLWMVNCE